RRSQIFAQPLADAAENPPGREPCRMRRFGALGHREQQQARRGGEGRAVRRFGEPLDARRPADPDLFVENESGELAHAMQLAGAKGVDSPRAISLVTWPPPTGTVSANTRLPSKKTPIVVVPPPMSMTVTPRSISSSTRQARPAAYGLTTSASTSRWERPIAAVWLRTLAAAAVTMCMLTASRSPTMPRGSRMPRLSSIEKPTGIEWIT